jgi:hypothetical protein
MPFARAHGPNYDRILLLAHTIIISFSLYRRTVTGFGQISQLDQYPEGLCGAFAISGVLGATVQV